MLPQTLLALLSASPVFSVLSSLPPKTPYDPFRAISLQVPKEPEQPICCLKPLAPLEPVEQEVLLSFEEWKARRSSQEQEASAHRPQVSEHAAEPSPPDPSVSSAAGSSVQEAGDAGHTPQDILPPHFRVPITDRFNYASTDCSARVHTSHRSAKSAYNILTSKKDRYMLSPCAKPDGEKQFVVVELCDDIRIDTVQLANFEFFSGVFKDFTVSVTKVYTDDLSEWTYAGTYRAKNVRGVQSFHPPTSLRDFYRYIRIDFHSHYGNEYYCPVSLLRVYGLTHLEEFKWDIWTREAEAEAKAKRAAIEEAVAASTQAQEAPQPESRPTEDSAARAVPISTPLEGVTKVTLQEQPPNTSSQNTEVSVRPSSNVSYPSARMAADSSSVPAKNERSESRTRETSTTTASHSTDTAGPKDTSVLPVSSGTSQDPSVSTHTSQNSVTTHDPHPQQITAGAHSEASSSSAVSSPSSHSASSQDVKTALSEDSSSPPPSSSVPTVISSPSSATAVSLSHASTGGESIYRTIMNRLSALEGNTTLYARYVEEHTAAIREVLRRLGEDVGRLEGIGKAQAQMYQRSMHEFDRYRRKLEMEHGELLSKVNYLADEVLLEKRLGIAQLCLLLVVLVFMALTRGSTVDGMVEHRAAAMLDSISGSSAMRDWGRRTLSFSGDWVSRFKANKGHPQSTTKSLRQHRDDKVRFPTRTSPPHNENLIKVSRKSEDARARKPRTPTSSLRTPGARHAHATHRRPLTPTGNRPPIQRSNSHGTPHDVALIGPVPRSAKRWARTAHLHEVKTPGRREPDSGAGLQLNGNLDVPGELNGEADTSLRSVRSNHDRLGVEGQARGPRTPSPLRLSSTNDSSPGHDPSQSSETDGDAWIDTDADASEVDHDADVFM